MRTLIPIACAAVAAIALEHTAPAQTPYISEFMADNERTLTDETGATPDWIEIHHPGAGFFNIGNYYLTDDPGDLTKWRFPPTYLILPQGHIIAFASGNDRISVGGYIHTNFRLSKSGEYLALVAPDGVTRLSEYSPSYPTQHPDISYGHSGSTQSGAIGYFTNPTPRYPNGSAGSALSNPTYSPAVVGDLDDLTITVRAYDVPGNPTARVDLIYRVNYSSPARIPMRDDGQGGDLIAGDGVWTGILSNTLSNPGQMLRWSMEASSVSGGTTAIPRPPPQGAGPEYLGTVVRDPAVSSQLPVIEWFVQNPSAAGSNSGTRCSLYYNGEFYDNVFVRLRGGSSTSWRKVSYKFDFDPGYHFRFDPAEDRVEEFNLNSTWSDKAFVRQILTYETYRDVGAAGSIAFPMRVQQNGVFHSVAVFIEQPDEDLLERVGLDPEGALYKMYNELTSAWSGVEKKTRHHESNGDLDALVQAIRAPATTRDPWLFDNVDLPAVISYLAATTLVHDNDHVAKNYYVYRDTDGDGEWRFLPWDKDLTLGRNYTLGGGVLNDTIWARQDPFSHPLFGDRSHQKCDNLWNRLIDALYANPRFRTMYLRRLRSVMDEFLQPTTTPAGSRYYESRIQTLRSQMLADCNLDRARWGVPSFGNRNYDFLTALTRLENYYLTIRRRHLYITHGPPTGLIPDAQSPNPLVRLGALALGGSNPAEDYIELACCGTEAVDLSGWRIEGRVAFDIEPGTVVLPGEMVYIAADLVAFRARTSGPGGGQQLLAVGPFERTARTDLALLDRSGRPVDLVFGVRYDLTTSGQGDMSVQVQGAPPNSPLLIPFSFDITQPLGCGPVLGLGLDILPQLSLPPGTAPFHVATDASGSYAFQLAPGTIPSGIVMDSRAFAIDLAALQLQWSEVHRVRF